MAWDDIQSAFQSFQQGLSQLQASRVLSQANEAVTQIRNSELDTAEKNNQLRALGQQMAFGLATQGVNPTQIEQLANTFMPPKPTPIQSLDQGLLSEDPAIQARAKQGLQYKAEQEAEAYARKQEDLYNRQGISINAADKRQEERIAKAEEKEKRALLTRFSQDYNKNVKDLREATRYAEQGLAVLNANGPAEKMIGAVSFAAARAAGSNSQLSDGERQALAGRQDLLSQFQQLVSTKAQSEFIEKNKESFRDLFKIYKQSAKDMENEIANAYTGQLKANPFFVDEDYNQIASKLTGGRIKQYTGPGIELPSAQAPATPSGANQMQSPAGVQPPSGTMSGTPNLSQRNKFFKPIGQ